MHAHVNVQNLNMGPMGHINHLNKSSLYYIAKFIYKLLHNILNDKLCVSKGNPNVQMSFENCEEIENIKQLLYGCKDSSFIRQI